MVSTKLTLVGLLQIRYRPDLPMVLKGMSCVIHPGEKVGVVGRTGSGKSTLIQALFRLIEPAGGRILIDGLDITTIGLNDLRSALGVIPQEPTLFEGSVRSNMDPFNKSSDQQIWEVSQQLAHAS
jgi:ATP-binding cassette subfamily C (CFTR/MRP) protein 2